MTKRTRIQLTQNIELQSITNKDCDELFDLMTGVYPKSYDYFWKDGGKWYVNFIYNKATVLAELEEANSPYFFILVDNEKVGVLRIQHGETFPALSDKKASKLHRIYLDPKTHGKGVGTILMNWTIEETRKQGNEILWLEGMDTKTATLGFYNKCGFEIGSHVVLPYERIHVEFRGMNQMWRAV